MSAGDEHRQGEGGGGSSAAELPFRHLWGERGNDRERVNDGNQHATSEQERNNPKAQTSSASRSSRED